MDYLFDEFSKSLNESVPRRESLRRLGALFAGTVLAPLGVGRAWAGKADPCKTFCSKCNTKSQQSRCVTTCRACGGDTGRLGGSCSNYVCCSVAACNGLCSDLSSDPNCGACGNDCRAHGKTCCGDYCADLDSDTENCGGCGAFCDPPGPGEYVTCIAGTCMYDCVEGAIDCNGTCTQVEWDPANCGACGNVCPASAPDCEQGVCTENICPAGTARCGGKCVNILFDNSNCGACGFACAPLDYCDGGTCAGSCNGC